MHCKSLWIKASAKCINVNVNTKSMESVGSPPPPRGWAWPKCACLYMRSGAWLWIAICREGRTFAFSAIRLKLAFSKMSYCTFKVLSTAMETANALFHHIFRVYGIPEDIVSDRVPTLLHRYGSRLSANS